MPQHVDETADPDKLVSVNRLIVGVLILGPVAALVVAIGVVSVTGGGILGGGPPGAFELVLAGLPAVVALGAGVAALVLAPIQRRKSGTLAAARPTPEEGEKTLRTGYGTWLVLRAGLHEGPAFFAAVVFMLLGGAYWPVLIVLAVQLALLVSMFPSRARMDAFMAQAVEAAARDPRA